MKGERMRLTDDLVRIAAAGGGFTVDSNGRTIDNLTRISAAAKGKATIVIRRASHMRTDDLVRIAAAGKGSVIFDLLD
jgi:hypothetical protein